jgi:anti-sigma factor RsiW
MLRLLGRRKSEEERRDELLSAYLDGELGERERQRLEARLAQDPMLRAELRALHQTVSLLEELPQVAARRNFILSRSMVERRQPAPRPAPEARLRWAAPLLTAATAVVSLLFAVVLVGDLLLPGTGGLASVPEAMEQPKEVPQIALEAEPADEAFRIEGEVARSPTLAPMAAAEAPVEEPEMAAEVEEEAGIEREVAPSPTLAPMAAAEAPVDELEMAVEEKARTEGEDTPSPLSTPAPAGEAPREEPEMAIAAEAEAAEGTQASEALPEEETPPALTAAAGGGPTEEATAPAAPTVEPSIAPTVVSGAASTVTIPPEAPTVSDAPPEGELGLLEPTPSEIEVTPLPIQPEERAVRGPSRGRLPWELLEVGLGLAALVLTFVTIQAWRVRRR